MKYQSSRVMGIDYGSVRIGIATSDLSRTIAFGQIAIDNNNKSIDSIIEIITSESVSEVVIGYPLSLKGTKTAQTLEVEKFEEKLKEKIIARLPGNEINVIRWDERFTSKMAEDSMLISGMKKKNRRNKSNIDIISAALLLQSYLDKAK